MVLYFVEHYQIERKVPNDLLDTNISTDYSKVSSIFKIGGLEENNFETLLRILTEETYTTRLTPMYSFQKTFTVADMVSLLFYNGIMTMAGSVFTQTKFSVPNMVIKQLYYQYFYDFIIRQSAMQKLRINVYEFVDKLMLDNNIKPFIQHIETILTELSNRDKIKFDEKHLKILFASLFQQVGYYLIFSEYEVSKKIKYRKRLCRLIISSPPTF